ncbi:hypothetical protein KI688_000097 [Linnemannia hyalina]|uniref:Uncharacterized protein n=1 Tax=Linnemannia hyalina TaxID=64524 RepID=A0A9P8BZU1_9FUNG|nr:hypothetical protein KI688_000097 [Linnemannia hyalina]
MGAKSNRVKQLKEARDRKKRKLDDTIDPTPNAKPMKRRMELLRTDAKTLDKEWEDVFEEEDNADSDSNSDPESEINDIQRNTVIMVDEVGRYVSARTKDGSLSKSGQENLEAVQ